METQVFYFCSLVGFDSYRNNGLFKQKTATGTIGKKSIVVTYSILGSIGKRPGWR